MYFFLEGKHPADTFQRHIILIRKPSLSSLSFRLYLSHPSDMIQDCMASKPVKKITSIYLQMIIQTVSIQIPYLMIDVQFCHIIGPQM